METEVTVTRYNVTALIGWLGLGIGLVGCIAQYFHRGSAVIPENHAKTRINLCF